jgi:hypothetical protein
LNRDSCQHNCCKTGVPLKKALKRKQNNATQETLREPRSLDDVLASLEKRSNQMLRESHVAKKAHISPIRNLKQQKSATLADLLDMESSDTHLESPEGNVDSEESSPITLSRSKKRAVMSFIDDEAESDGSGEEIDESAYKEEEYDKNEAWESTLDELNSSLSDNHEDGTRHPQEVKEARDFPSSNLKAGAVDPQNAQTISREAEVGLPSEKVASRLSLSPRAYKVPPPVKNQQNLADFLADLF